ncbi:MAG: GNAT family N-acetyltransferase [Gemmatimonadetes bacterium]|nr:GNAT family N-acetyltransferase [Gemmatimonadota bacterium]
MGLRIRDAVVADHAAVLVLNNGAVPHVNALDAARFDELVGYAIYFRVAEDESGIAGFVLCVAPGTPYWSDNYAWFAERYGNAPEAFVYLDRVVVAPRARRSGVGRLLYADLEQFVRGRWPRVTLEVNVRPPNPTSVEFHQRMGFVEVGVREYDDGAGTASYAVSMMERTL